MDLEPSILKMKYLILHFACCTVMHAILILTDPLSLTSNTVLYRVADPDAEPLQSGSL